MACLLLSAFCLLPYAFGASMACSSGDPTHCARTDRAVQAYKLLTPPPVGIPFVNEFGEREVRVTGPCTATQPGAAQLVIGQSGNANYCNYGAHASANDSASQIGIYDSALFHGDGGYRAVFVTDGGAFGLFSFDAKTLEVYIYGGSAGSDIGMSHTSPAVYFDLSGTTLQASCFPDSQNPDPKWGCTPGGSVNLYDFSTCPNLPFSLPTGYAASAQFYSDATDTWITNMFSIRQDQNPGLILAYNTSTHNCVWFNPATFQYGGTGLTTTHLSGGPFGDSTAPGGTLAAPTISQTTGGTIASGTKVYAKVTENAASTSYAAGESTASAEASVTLSAQGAVQVSIPACSDPLWCSSAASAGPPFYYVYLGTSSGSEVLQDYLALSGSGLGPYTGTIPVEFDSGSITAGDSTYQGYDSGGTIYYYDPVTGNSTSLGTVNYSTGAVSITFPSGHTVSGTVFVRWGHGMGNTVTYNSLRTGTATPPSTNTAGMELHAIEISPNDVIHFDGNGSNGNSHYFWTVGTSTFNWCGGSSAPRPCYGHFVMGNQNVLFAAGQPEGNLEFHAAVGTYPYSNLATATILLTPPPSLSADPLFINLFGDTHYAWSNDNATDTEPFFTTISPERSGVTPTSPLQLEFWSTLAEAGSPVYRYAFSRATETAYWGPSSNSFWDGAFGAQSPDGKFVLFSTNWDNSLGWNQNTPAWTNGVSYSAGNVVTDTNGNLEIETASSCTAAASGTPAWSTSMNGKTTDNNCSWTLVGIAGQPFAGLTWTASTSTSGVVTAGYYIAGLYVIDSNRNLEIETATSCVSGTNAPTWNTTSGQTTTDGSCVWRNLGSTGITSAPAAVDDRQDVFILELN